MAKGKFVRVAVLMGGCALLLLLVQGRLLARSWELERWDFRTRAQVEARDAFHRLPLDGARLEELGRALGADPSRLASPEARERALLQAEGALQVEAGFGPSFRERMAAAGLGGAFRHAITLQAFLAHRPGAPDLVLLDARGPGEERRVAGDLEGWTASDRVTSFFYMGTHHYVRLNLYVRHRRVDLAALGRMKGLLALAALSMAMVLGAFAGGLWVIRRQEALAELQAGFIDVMTHELNTPLSTVAVAAGNLRHPALRADPGALEHLASVILRQVERLRTLVDCVSRLAALEEAGRLERTPIAVHGLLAEAAQDLRTRHGEARLELVEHYRAREDEADLDVQLFRSAVANLLENAVKYSEGRARVELSTWNEGRMLVVEVADRGMGIPRALLGRLFQRFFRAPEAVRRAPGLGLGLHTARRVAEAHGGGISAARREGGGSRFVLRVPLRGGRP